jgi:hypothetical protein
VAAKVKDELQLDAELIEGGRGEFTVWVGDRMVAQKSPQGFPSEEDVLAAVRQALAG